MRTVRRIATARGRLGFADDFNFRKHAKLVYCVAAAVAAAYRV